MPDMVHHYRDLFTWGDHKKSEPLEEPLLTELKERIEYEHQELDEQPGMHPIAVDLPSKLADKIITQLEAIVDQENVSTESEDLLRNSFGSSYVDYLKLRQQQIDTHPDAVVAPRTEKEIEEILTLCLQEEIAVVPLGGKSSVTQGIAYPNGGIALDLTKHLHSIHEINEVDNTVTVEAGIYGPDLEQQLQTYHSDNFPRGFTIGHFPQSFEYSTVGGWVVTRGAGQESTGYGKIEDMVLGIRMITPTGVLELPTYPAKALGPDLIQVVVGSEGTLGIVTQVVLKIRPRQESNRYGAFLIKSWEDGIAAVRQVMQGRSGKPFVFRLSDPEETAISLAVAGFGGLKDWVLTKLGYLPGKRVLLLVSTSGSAAYAKVVMQQIRKAVKANNGMYVGSSPVKTWFEDRFETPYLRDSLMDHDIIIDTLETATTWNKMLDVWQQVRAVIKARGKIICMTHISHMYENGGNLYFIFMTKAPTADQVQQYQNFQNQIIDAIHQAGGSLSHHHGIGRLYGPRLEDEVGTVAMRVLRAIKAELDPKHIMNPGGTLGLDN